MASEPPDGGDIPGTKLDVSTAAKAVTLDHEHEHPEEVYIRKQFRLLQYRLHQLSPAARARVQSRITQELIDEPVALETPRGPVSFVMVGKGAAGRALSLLRKQPATIAWINSFASDSVFWDVGANIGVYSLYAARRGDIRVVAFEPAAVNYFVLAANCEANALQERIDCLLVGLGRERAIGHLELSQFAPAESFSFNGKRDRPRPGRQAAIVLPIDELVDEYGLACPNYLKVDVPGLTESVVAGAARTLRRPELREIHIEMVEQSASGQRLMDVLSRSGFALQDRHGHGGSGDLTFVRQAKAGS